MKDNEYEALKQSFETPFLSKNKRNMAGQAQSNTIEATKSTRQIENHKLFTSPRAPAHATTANFFSNDRSDKEKFTPKAIKAEAPANITTANFFKD